MCRRVLRFGLLASALCLGAVLGCSVGTPVEGSGKSASEERDIGDVSEVTLAGGGDLQVIPGEVNALVVTADDNLLPLIETPSSGRKLTLRTKSGYALRPQTPITFTLFVKKLEKINISGSGNATAEGLSGEALEVKVTGTGNVTLRGLEQKEFTLGISGSGNATLTGSAKKMTVKVSGAGDVDAGGLRAASADVSISGSGDATVWATEDLKARVSGAGDVRYRGSPRVDQKVSGAGSITPIGE